MIRMHSITELLSYFVPNSVRDILRNHMCFCEIFSRISRIFDFDAKNTSCKSITLLYNIIYYWLKIINILLKI